MNPEELIKNEKVPETKLDEHIACYEESRLQRQMLEVRWARNNKILKGVSVENESTVSKTTGRHKIYFRKVWSSAWRLLGSFYQSFLMDKNRFKIVGRDDGDDWMKAKVLEFVVKFRFYRMLRRHSAFVKLIWAFFDCISPGLSVVKLFWRYREEEVDGQKVIIDDEPDFTVYPLEQVLLDWQADTVDQMRFVGFENYLTKHDLEDMGYEQAAIDNARPMSVPQSVLRHARYANAVDPAKPSTAASTNYNNGTVGQNFPESGEAGAATSADHPMNRYLAVEMFYRRKGKKYFCVFDPHTREYFKKPALSEFGTLYPVAVGHMLAEAHKLVPEGLPEILEGPQEALNLDINLRKDNVRLAMNGGFIYGKFGGVDKQAFRNVHPGWSVAAADVSQVVPIKVPDVTPNAHIEINQDMAMIEEMSGVNDTILGQSSTGKTGEAQINFQQASVKLDLNTAMVAQTLFHQFIYVLAYMCQRFESNETVLRLANDKLRDTNDPRLPDNYANIFDIEFDMDVEVDVGISEVSRSVRAQRAMSFVQMMNQANQATFGALASGIQIEKPRIWNVGEAALEFAPDFGIDNPSRFLVAVAPPPPEAEGQEGGSAPAPGGAPAQATQGGVPQPNEKPAQEDNGFAQFMQQAVGGGGDGG